MSFNHNPQTNHPTMVIIHAHILPPQQHAQFIADAMNFGVLRQPLIGNKTVTIYSESDVQAIKDHFASTYGDIEVTVIRQQKAA